MTQVIFNKEGYDPFIEFLKAYSIFLVVVAHCLPTVIYNYTLFCIWGDMQVPMFILVQVFHAYKKNNKPLINFKKLLKRIVIPFVLIQSFIVSILLITHPNAYREIFVETINGGG